jgi:hypothetical protein
MSTVPLASQSPAYHPFPSGSPVQRLGRRRGRAVLWLGGLATAACIYFGINAFWQWPHVIGSSGGRYFIHRIELPVPALEQDDPRWGMQLLGPTIDTIGQEGCALTSAAMVLSYYGIDTDPQRLNQFLTANGGYTPNGWLYWEKAAAIAPGRVEKAYEDLPSYALIDRNLLAGNPVIVRLTLRNGTLHFVVVVGKEGWDYLTRDPARPVEWGVYPLKELTPRIEALRFYRVLPMPASPPAAPVQPMANALPPAATISPNSVPPAGTGAGGR